MKKARLILMFTIICFAFIPRVFATNYMSIDKTNVKVGEEFVITVSTDFEISDWDILVTPTENASNCRLTSNSPVLYEPGPGSMEHKNCVINTPGTATFTLSGTITTVGTDENPEGQTITIDEERIDVTVTADEEKPKGLDSLTVSGGTLSPTFSSDTNTGYVITLSTDATTFSINATAKSPTVDNIVAKRENGDEYETISLNNINFTTAGDNSTMLIIISVGEGERKVDYQIQVTKEQKEIAPPALIHLSIDGENINIVEGKIEYDITLEDKETYLVDATINDTTNYMFKEYLTPPFSISNKEFPIEIVPKKSDSGLSNITYIIRIKTNYVEPITTKMTTTTKKSSSGGGGNATENPKSGTSGVYVVGTILVLSFVVSIYLYKKNINGYN